MPDFSQTFSETTGPPAGFTEAAVFILKNDKAARTLSLLPFSKPQKTIFQAPFHSKPKPIWFNSRGIAAQKTFKKLVDFEVDPSPWKVPAILWNALRD
jgi:hypothetical protein